MANMCPAWTISIPCNRLSDFLASLLNICISSTRSLTRSSRLAWLLLPLTPAAVEVEAAAKAVGTKAAAAAAAAFVR